MEKGLIISYREEKPMAKPAADVGERLFLWRDAAGWSQAETARRAGVSRTSVVLTETGETRPRLPTLRRLARAFGVTVEQFLHGEITNTDATEERTAKEAVNVT